MDDAYISNPFEELTQFIGINNENFNKITKLLDNFITNLNHDQNVLVPCIISPACGTEDKRRAL